MRTLSWHHLMRTANEERLCRADQRDAQLRLALALEGVEFKQKAAAEGEEAAGGTIAAALATGRRHHEERKQAARSEARGGQVRQHKRCLPSKPAALCKPATAAALTMVSMPFSINVRLSHRNRHSLTALWPVPSSLQGRSLSAGAKRSWSDGPGGPGGPLEPLHLGGTGGTAEVWAW